MNATEKAHEKLVEANDKLRNEIKILKDNLKGRKADVSALMKENDKLREGVVYIRADLYAVERETSDNEEAGTRIRTIALFNSYVEARLVCNALRNEVFRSECGDEKIDRRIDYTVTTVYKFEAKDFIQDERF